MYDLINEQHYRAVMRKFARFGTGIEINLSCFSNGWHEHEDSMLRLYRLAAEEGCKFYLASDAHHPEELSVVSDRALEVISALGLTKDDQFILPVGK